MSRTLIILIHSGIPEKPFASCIFTCPGLDHSTFNTSKSAAISIAANSGSSKFITKPVSIFPENDCSKNQEVKKYQLAVCLMDRVYGWTNWLKLISFLEYYLILGAEKIIIYKHSWFPMVEKFVSKYERLSITVYEFPPLIGVNKYAI